MKELDTTAVCEGNAEATTTDAYAELLASGSAVLKAATREALVELVENIPADSRYMVGAVGRTEEGAYTIQVDLIKEE